MVMWISYGGREGAMDSLPSPWPLAFSPMQFRPIQGGFNFPMPPLAPWQIRFEAGRKTGSKPLVDCSHRKLWPPWQPGRIMSLLWLQFPILLPLLSLPIHTLHPIVWVSGRHRDGEYSETESAGGQLRSSSSWASPPRRRPGRATPA